MNFKKLIGYVLLMGLIAIPSLLLAYEKGMTGVFGYLGVIFFIIFLFFVSGKLIEK